MTTRAQDNRLERINSLQSNIQANIYQAIAPLAICAWRSPEPVSFPLRETGEQSQPQIGQQWAQGLFDCAWMRFHAKLPPALPEGEVVARIDINGELAIVDTSGTPVRGLTNVKSTFDPALGGPGKTVWQLPEAMVESGIVEFWADCATNDLFGFVKGDGRIELTEIAVVREDARHASRAH